MRKTIDFLKHVLLLLMMASATVAFADVADPDAWVEVVTDRGDTITARWMGDEFFHFLVDSEGNTYMTNEKGSFSLVDKVTLDQLRETSVQQRVRAYEQQSGMRKLSSQERDYFKDRSTFLGKRKGIVILLEFGDDDGEGGKDASTAFKFSPDITGETLTHFDNFFNKSNFTEGKFIGSVHDYFYDQSYGKFDLTFDIVGPITLSRNSAYYSGTTGHYRSGELALEALSLADDIVDFSQYDWDDDGYVNQVAFLYAGGTPSTGGTIWPHKYTLTEAAETTLTLDGKIIDVYCVINELTKLKKVQVPAGIGTFIHEYSHCFGFPDLYDVNHWAGYGVGFFDVMGSGEKNGDSYIPAGYSAYEKMIMGWLDPVVLSEPCKIRDMQPLSKNGETYIFYTDNPDSTEYYIMENRQKDRWDAGLPAWGLLVYRVDFGRLAWEWNVVNSGRYVGINLHERFRVINADDNPLVYHVDDGYYIGFDLQKGVPFPQPGHNAFSDSTKPVMQQFNGGDKKQLLYNREMTDITQNADGTISFDFHLPGDDAPTVHGLYLDETAMEPVAYEASADENTRYNVHTNIAFKTNRWLTLWLPFALTDDEVQEALGPNTRVALFNGAGDDCLKFYTTQDGIPANTPALVYLEDEHSLRQLGTMSQRYIPQASSGEVEAVESKIGSMTFVGVGCASTVPEGCYFISNGALYKSEGTTSLKAFKGFFRSAGSDVNSIGIDVAESGYETYVDDHLVSLDDEVLGDIYSIGGILVRKDAVTTEGLPKGVYLLHGKKIVVK